MTRGEAARGSSGRRRGRPGRRGRKGLLGLTVLGAALLAVVGIPATSASAHPLGNFSVNQHVGLILRPDRIEATVVVDAAEIPTLQDRAQVDADSDAAVTPAELAAHAARVCREVAQSIDAQLDHHLLAWTVSGSAFGYAPGAGGLATSRLRCALSAPATLDRPARLRVDNTYLADRAGWREMTAAGAGVRLIDSPLPARSVSDELRAYPDDLLVSAPDLRSATVRAEPGTGTAGAPASRSSPADPVSRWLAALDRRFADLAGGPRLTPLVGLLAVALALVLGAGHAVLPGHGKTVLAAYLVGKRGRPRDAVAVAATVTLTHTGGVLALGLLLSAGMAVAGEQVLGWLGLVSGAVVLAVGAGMLLGVARARRHLTHGHRTHGHRTHGHRTHGHAHTHPHGDGHGPTNDDGTGHHPHGGHSHAHGDGDGHGPTNDGTGHHPHGGHSHDHGDGHGRTGRASLAGIGLAGGLVPSPSALVVLLAAIGLGRTGFGVLLVVAYGVGMAATLTGAGLLLVAVSRRMARATDWPHAKGPDARRLVGGVSRVVARLHAATPMATAVLIVGVGAGLAARAAASVL